MDENLIPPYGGFRDLAADQRAGIVHDATVVFTDDGTKPTKGRVHQEFVVLAGEGLHDLSESHRDNRPRTLLSSFYDNSGKGEHLSCNDRVNRTIVQESSTPKRMLATIVFTDAVGYSALTNRDEDAALRAFAADAAIMTGVCGEYQGQVVKNTGDGLLMTFDSAVEAVRAAMEIQGRLTESHALRPGPNLQHRIGIHLGDVVLNEGDVYGDGVNIAARLQTEAMPGGIYLSQTVHDVVRGKVPLGAVFMGDRSLKNIEQAVPAWQIPAVGTSLDELSRLTRTGQGRRPDWRRPALGAALAIAATVLAFAFVHPRFTAVLPAAEAGPKLDRETLFGLLAPSPTLGHKRFVRVDLNDPADGPTTFRDAKLLSMARRYLGTPYVWGGREIGTGIDCSHYLCQIFGSAGVKIVPPIAKMVPNPVGDPVADTLHFGDVIYLTQNLDSWHAVMYIGHGRIIHASSKNGVVEADLTPIVQGRVGLVRRYRYGQAGDFEVGS